MARKPRIHFPGAFYHIITRGNKGQKVFQDNSDYQLYLNFLKEYKDRFGFFLYAYVMMPTHIHLLVEVGGVSFSRVMQGLQGRYTRHYNLKYQSLGTSFSGPVQSYSM